MPSIFACLCFFLTIAVLQKPCQGNFKDLTRVGLAFLKKIVLFWRFKKSRINLLANTGEESWFLNAAKTCSYGLKIPENTKIKRAFQYKSLFHLSSFFHTNSHTRPKLTNWYSSSCQVTFWHYADNLFNFQFMFI